MPKIFKKKERGWRGCEEGTRLCCWLEMCIGTATMDNSVEVIFFKVKNRVTI